METQTEPINQVGAFLYALFEHLPPGHIEIRLIEDRKGGKMLARRWYEGAKPLLEVLSKVAEYADTKKSGVFFGVLPRKQDGLGKAKDVLPGYAAWVDLDFRDFKGGEEECRKGLASFPFQPTTVVRSGHGLHAYWLLKEAEEPRTLVGLSARLAHALNGDNVADAARILRLPGTTNHKNPDNPVPVMVEIFDPDRRYTPGDFDEFLPDLPEEQRHEEPAHVEIGPQISERVRELIDDNQRIRNLFEGKGKPERGEDGKRLDTTSSGYDYSFVATLIKKGVTDEAELATALWHRLDDAARSKGKAYILKTVRKALTLTPRNTVKKEKTEEEAIDFTVERVRIFDSNPRVYELTIQGIPVSLSTGEILSPTRFQIRFVDALSRVPSLPNGKVWRKQVNMWLAQAEVVEQPPEASEAAYLREEILMAINNLAVGESIDDIDRGKAFQHEGALIFKTLPLRKLLKDTYGDVRSNILCMHLKGLGYVSKTVRVDGKVVRAWTGKGPGGDAQEGREAGE